MKAAQASDLFGRLTGALKALEELKEVVPPKDWKKYAQAVLDVESNSPSRLLWNVTTFEHLKTGNRYSVWGDIATDATNATEGRKMVIYERHDGLYVREEREFDDKFRPC